jgi:hypothetical protein
MVIITCGPDSDVCLNFRSPEGTNKKLGRPDRFQITREAKSFAKYLRIHIGELWLVFSEAYSSQIVTVSMSDLKIASMHNRCNQSSSHDNSFGRLKSMVTERMATN